MNCEPQTVYLCIITWPDGTEGLLFPRPGNVPIADTLEKGQSDFMVAKLHLEHLKPFIQSAKLKVDPAKLNGDIKIRLVKFQFLEVLAEHVHRA